MKKLVLGILLAAFVVASVWAADTRFPIYPKTYINSVAVTDTSTADSSVLSGYVGITQCDGANAVHGRIYIAGPIEPYAGAGNTDSCRIWAYVKWFNTRTLIDSSLCGALPCSLDFKAVDTIGYGSGLIRGELEMRYSLWDTLSDTTGVTMNYRIDQYIELK